MKKILALFCVFAMFFTVCGCSTTSVETTVLSTADGENNNADNTAVTDGDNNAAGTQNGGSDGDSSSGKNSGSNSVIDNPLDVDLKGATVIVYDARDIFKVDSTASKTEQAMGKILEKIKKELNCKLEVKSVDLDKLISLTSTSAASGKAIGGIITVSLYESGRYISNNLVADLCKVSSLDISKDYMNRADVIDSTGFGNGKYGIGIDVPTRIFCTFYNKRILKELGYNENYLYDLVDSGKWTFSEYRKLAKEATKDLDGKSGMSEKDQWGQSVQDGSSGMAPNIVASMGIKKINLVNGELKLNMTDSKIMEALNLSREILTNDGTAWSASGDEAVSFFATGKSLFLYAYGTKASGLTKMKDEFGLLPSPKVDGAKDYTTVVDGNVAVMMIPAGLSAKDQYNAGAVIQAYNYLYENDVVSATKKEYVNRYFCDEKSGENWLLAGKQVTSEPNQCYSRISETILAGTERVFWDYIGKGTSPSAAIESTKVSTQKALDELNQKIKDK